MKNTVYATRDYGDFVLRLQYVNANPHEVGSDYEPAIVVCRGKRSQSRAAWIIMLSSAFKYVDDPQKGGHSSYMQAASLKMCDMLNLNVSRKQAFRIAEAILDNLEDMINMPPVNWQPEPLADIEATIDGTKINASVH